MRQQKYSRENFLLHSLNTNSATQGNRTIVLHHKKYSAKAITAVSPRQVKLSRRVLFSSLKPKNASPAKTLHRPRKCNPSPLTLLSTSFKLSTSLSRSPSDNYCNDDEDDIPFVLVPPSEVTNTTNTLTDDDANNELIRLQPRVQQEQAPLQEQQLFLSSTTTQEVFENKKDTIIQEKSTSRVNKQADDNKENEAIEANQSFPMSTFDSPSPACSSSPSSLTRSLFLVNKTNQTFNKRGSPLKQQLEFNVVPSSLCQRDANTIMTPVPQEETSTDRRVLISDSSSGSSNTATSWSIQDSGVKRSPPYLPYLSSPSSSTLTTPNFTHNQHAIHSSTPTNDDDIPMFHLPYRPFENNNQARHDEEYHINHQTPWFPKW